MLSKDISGQRFGKLIAIRYYIEDAEYAIYWLCLCDCGNTRLVKAKQLDRGKVTCCGCAEIDSKKAHKELLYRRIYRVYHNMIGRCTNIKNRCYHGYGGRGISVCSEWQDDFRAFLAHVSKLPHYGQSGYSLNRIDNNGNYEPCNIEWATPIEQARNKRNNVMLTYNGKTQCVSAWEEELKISRYLIHQRIKQGLFVVQVLDTHVKK